MIQPINTLKTMAKSFGVAKKDLLVLAPANDPFNSGTDANVEQAEWFGSLLENLDLPRGKHLRRYFYLLVTLERPVLLPNDEPFENTDACWNYLQDASRHARYMGLVDAGEFNDNRNPSAVEFQGDPRHEPVPSWSIGDFWRWVLPTIYMQSGVLMDLPDINVSGYDYDDGDQPYHLECWIEKSTMDEELDPICRRFRVTKKQGIGFDSVTSVVKLLERCQDFMEMNRPIRIFYVSDFDPAGYSMPQAIARQIQFWLWRHGCEADIRLKPLLMTQEQIDQYQLPRKPIKESDKRKGNFEQRHGEGHVELDALAAIYPGEFERIVTQAFTDYRDESIEEELDDAYSKATDNAAAAWQSATAGIQEEVDSLREKALEISEKYEYRVDALREEIELDLAPIREEMNALYERAQHECSEAASLLHVDIPSRPSAEPPAEADDGEWLFDSTRSYGEQLGYFHAHKNGEQE